MYSLDKEGKQDEEGIRAAAKDGGYEGRGVEECMVIVGYGMAKRESLYDQVSCFYYNYFISSYCS